MSKKITPTPTQKQIRAYEQGDVWIVCLKPWRSKRDIVFQLHYGDVQHQDASKGRYNVSDRMVSFYKLPKKLSHLSLSQLQEMYPEMEKLFFSRERKG